MVSRESAFLLNNIVLVSALFTIFLGTIFPLLSEAVAGMQVSVGAPYFNSVTVPLFLFLVFLMGVGPMIAWRRASWDNLKRNFFWPAAASLAVRRRLVYLEGTRLFAVVRIYVVRLRGFFNSLRYRAGVARAQAHRRRRQSFAVGNSGPAQSAALRRIRRSSGGGVDYHGHCRLNDLQHRKRSNDGLKQELNVGNYRVQFEGLKGSQQPTHFRVEGSFRVFHNGNDQGILTPALKFFPTQQSPVGRAVHQSSSDEDIYLILSGFSELDRNQATLKVLVRPLVIWMWIGGFVIALGTLVCIWPMGKTESSET